FGQWVGVHLSGENKRQLWIPEGFAHGFVTLTETADFLYKTTNYYCRDSDRGILWNDGQLAITWSDQYIDYRLSDKDQQQPSFIDADPFL
ncbi:dTDP-4-dehydrorhamnose 3,5-epimerase family protein, partial [Aeromonas sp. 600527]